MPGNTRSAAIDTWKHQICSHMHLETPDLQPYMPGNTRSTAIYTWKYQIHSYICSPSLPSRLNIRPAGRSISLQVCRANSHYQLGNANYYLLSWMSVLVNEINLNSLPFLIREQITKQRKLLFMLSFLYGDTAVGGFDSDIFSINNYSTY